MIKVHHAATDVPHEHPNGARWHVDDKGQLHVLSAKSDERGNGDAVASYARGEWSSVRHEDGLPAAIAEVLERSADEIVQQLGDRFKPAANLLRMRAKYAQGFSLTEAEWGHR